MQHENRRLLSIWIFRSFFLFWKFNLDFLFFFVSTNDWNAIGPPFSHNFLIGHWFLGNQIEMNFYACLPMYRIIHICVTTTYNVNWAFRKLNVCTWRMKTQPNNTCQMTENQSNKKKKKNNKVVFPNSILSQHLNGLITCGSAYMKWRRTHLRVISVFISFIEPLCSPIKGADFNSNFIYSKEELIHSIDINWIAVILVKNQQKIDFIEFFVLKLLHYSRFWDCLCNWTLSLVKENVW